MFREVYIITDAEKQTRQYSNRMAGHILKQHQFNALTKLRGWKYTSLGAFDDGGSTTIAKVRRETIQSVASTTKHFQQYQP